MSRECPNLTNTDIYYSWDFKMHIAKVYPLMKDKTQEVLYMSHESFYQLSQLMQQLFYSCYVLSHNITQVFKYVIIKINIETKHVKTCQKTCL